MGALRLEVDSLRSELQEKDIELMDVKDSRNEEVDFLRDQLEETQVNSIHTNTDVVTVIGWC